MPAGSKHYIQPPAAIVFLVPYTRSLLTTKNGLGPTPGTKFVICLLVIVSHTMHNLYKAMSFFYTWTTFSLPKLILHQTTFGSEKLSAPTNLLKLNFKRLIYNTREAIHYAPFMNRALHVQLTNCMHSNRILPQPKPKRMCNVSVPLHVT